VLKISPSPGFDPRTVQPVASRYNDYATGPTIAGSIRSKSIRSETVRGKVLEPKVLGVKVLGISVVEEGRGLILHACLSMLVFNELRN
jgi:hypothetical protein